ncbi:T9SS type A sorting domain-containing protein [Taibaiella soli]|uniref:T9SS C-terminal target domain-containing protein n=1 Tax=Taibaiella soli TaxID=1649169 RepID=A0A2W2BC73_9BACT|nr:T9SS type A sorting domain-containing protein [Taibaiella soli]PZF73487.1 T9SS C-terminal target domain-containing protein [Taibaiella soli]
MKKFFLPFLLSAAFIGRTSAQTVTVVNVQDSISTNTHWTNDQQYLLKGYVYVTAGATLTIDSGTIIKGDKNTKGSLIVERGAKLIAVGTPTAPIVFTSNQAPGNRSYGDWGGVILCGKAPNNWASGTSQVEGGPRSLYGGTDAHDNSGQLSYVRIEFPGIAFSPNNEINGLTLCSVGDGTQLDHIQVSYSGDDSYEWFGGTVNAKYLVALGTWDDDFDTDNGYKGKNQFVASLRANAADQSGSKAFESDSYQTGTVTGLTDTTGLTAPVFSNATILGPIQNPANFASVDPNFVSALHIRRGSALSLVNSIVVGYPAGVLIDESAAAFGSTVANITADRVQFRHNIVAGIPTASTPSRKEFMYVVDGARSLTPTNLNADTVTNNPFNPFAGPFSWGLNPAFGNKIYTSQSGDVRLQDPFNMTNPNMVPTSTSPIVYNAAHTFNPNNPLNPDTTGNYANYNMPGFAPNFNDNKSSDAFFTKVNYVGAFAGTGTTNDNWMSGWCNFDPLHTDYSKVNTPTAVATLPTNVQSAVVFPNPAANNATVMVQLKDAGTLRVVVADITGKLVKEVFAGDKVSGTQNIDINLSDMNTGLYMVLIQSNGTQKNAKLSVIK